MSGQWKIAAVASVVSSIASIAGAGALLVGGPATTDPAFAGFGYILPESGVVPGRRVNNSGLAIGWMRQLDSTGIGVAERASAWHASNSWSGVLDTPVDVTTRADYQAYAVNASGVIVGHGAAFNTSGENKGIRAIRWDSVTAAPVMLSPLNTDASGSAIAEAYAINDANTIVGAAHWYGTDGLDYGTRVVRWSAGSNTPTQLNGFAPNSEPNQAAAYAVNESNTVVGFASDGNRYFAARWVSGSTTAERLTDLGRGGDGETVSMALDVNAGGAAVGYSTRYASSHGERPLGPRATRWNAGTTQVVELGLFGTDGSDFTASQANAINDAGVVVGYASKYSDRVYIGTRPTRWNANSTAVIELGMLGASADGNAQGTADDINELGTVVGHVQKFNGTTLLGDRAVYWLNNAPQSAIDLNQFVSAESGWTLTTARGISDTGFITGLGKFDPDGPGGTSAYDRQYTVLIPAAGTYGQGDANFDTQVDFDDLLLLAQHYGQSNSTQNIHVGDLDLNGLVNFDDLLALAQHYKPSSTLGDVGTLGSTFTADWSLARSMAPEPTGTLVLGFAFTRLARRRRQPGKC